MTSIHESCPPVGSGVEGLYGSPRHRGPQDRSAARPVRRADTIEQGFFIDEAEDFRHRRSRRREAYTGRLRMPIPLHVSHAASVAEDFLDYAATTDLDQQITRRLGP